MDIEKVHLDPNTNEEIQHKLPLGLCKQVVMKLESAMVDVLEIKEDDDISEETKNSMEGLSELLGECVAFMVCMVNEEIGEEEFIREVIDMDEIDPYPGDEQKEDILKMEI